MGYAVWPSGRLHLPQPDDPAAVEAVKAAWATVAGMVRRDGPGFDLDEIPPGDTVADVSWVDEIPPGATIAGIAEVAAASVTRDGDWLEFAFDEVGDPKWSNRATAFFVAIAPFVRSGTVQFIGETDERWSYTYADGQIIQQGLNGWDHSIVMGRMVSALAYIVESSGRVNLPRSDDDAAVAAVKAACAGLSGAFHPDLSSPGETLLDLAWVGATPVARDGDWLDFGDAEANRPRSRWSRLRPGGRRKSRSWSVPNSEWTRWSDQVTAFYVAIAPFVRSGTVRFIGEDESPDWVGRYPDARWSYVYTGGQITQQGWNGWDKSIEPFGEPVQDPEDFV